MTQRLLNVASIVCLVACVALMGLWVRSYETLSDELHWYLADYKGVLAFSTQGQVMFYVGPVMEVYSRTAQHWPWIILRGPNDNFFEFSLTSPLQTESNQFGFGSSLSWTASCLHLPDWFLVLATGLLAMAFQLRWPWRFGLRSLFIVTTFLAFVLRMIACLDRAWIGKCNCGASDAQFHYRA